jgi:hypothetical protein
MAKFLSDRQQSLRVGISSYTESSTVLQTIGRVGIGTTNAGGRSLYVIGNAEVTGILSATAFYGSGANLTDLIGAKIGGLDIKNEGVSIGSSFSTLNLIGDYVTATGIGSTANITFSTNLVGTALTISGISSLTQIAAGGTTGQNSYVLSSTGTGLSWQPVTSVGAGTLNGIIVQDEGSVVGTPGNITTLNFVGGNVTASAAGVAATITLSSNLVGTALSISGISTLGVTTATSLTAQRLNISGISTLTQIAAGGTTGQNSYVLSSTGTGLSWQPITSVGGGVLNGIIVQDEGSTVGTAGSITTLNFVGSNVTASAVALGATATITLSSNLVGTALTISGISTFSRISVGGTTGQNSYVLSSTGTGLSWQPVTSLGAGSLNGIIVREEGSTVGTAGSITILDFVGGNITASAVALGATATISLSNTPTFTTLVVTGITTSADFNSTSDINLKKDITKIENPLETIEQLNGVKFTWKSSDKKSIGVIAQEVEKVLPELVSQNETKTVNYNGIIGVLIEAVKELSAEVQELKSQLNN